MEFFMFASLAAWLFFWPTMTGKLVGLAVFLVWFIHWFYKDGDE